jgi:hypothetical protein
VQSRTLAVKARPKTSRARGTVVLAATVASTEGVPRVTADILAERLNNGFTIPEFGQDAVG